MTFPHPRKKIETPRWGVNFSASAEKIEMFFHVIHICQRSSKQLHTTTTNMFSFLNTGDINNSIRGLTNLPGLSTSDSDKIKYVLLNHSTAMRKNLEDGAPIFRGIRQLEAELEQRDISSITSGVLPSMAANAAAAAASASASTRVSLFADNDLRIDNAALAFIMAKELAFLNRTVQMITLIAHRYQEEQEDLAGGRTPMCRDSDSDSDDDPFSPPAEDLEQGSSPLMRSHSHPTNENCGSATRGISSQLAATFLVASGNLHQRFNNLCALTGTNLVLVNGMTTIDNPVNEENRRKQLTAQSLVVSDIFLHFGKFDAEHRDPVVMAFLELRDISVYAWRVLSMYAFSNLFRLLEGSNFAKHCYQPNDAIFTQGRDYSLRQEPAAVAVAVMQFPRIHNDNDGDNEDETTTTTTLTMSELADLAARQPVEEEDATEYN
jgi:hypothetical protein